MLEVFQNKCPRKILHIFWPNKITNAKLHERTGMLPDVDSKSRNALDHRRKQEEGTTKIDAEKVRGARDEGSRVELGPGHKAGSGQTTMPLLGVGLMWEHARRGLSK